MTIITRSIILLIFILVFFLPKNAQAHVLKADGSIGAVMHVNPEDDPIAGEPSSFFFEFKDKTNKFKPEKCECRIIILASNNELYSQPLFTDNANPDLQNASFSYTFPKKGVYIIKIVGKPLIAGTFDNFTLEYNLRVSRTLDDIQTSNEGKNAATQWLSDHGPHMIGGIIGFIILLIVIVKTGSKNHAKK